MADFHTHVTVSSVLGCGYSVAGMMMGMPPSTALVAGGLCGVAGMLPDVDSDSGIPRREAMGFAAAIVPMLLVERFAELQLRHDQMVLLAAVIYFSIRFVAAKLIGRWSVHRGMWHSLPAVLIFAGLAFLIAGPSQDLAVRYFKAFAVGLGALSHLVLDEVYSVDTRGVVPKFKKSFGSAVKLWGKNGWANFSTYAKLLIVAAMILAEPSVLARLETRNPELAERIRGYSDRIREYGPRNRQPSGRGAPIQPAPTGAPSPAPPGSHYGPPVNGAPNGPAFYAPPTESPIGQTAAPWQPAPGLTPAGRPANARAPLPAPVIRRQ